MPVRTATPVLGQRCDVEQATPALGFDESKLAPYFERLYEVIAAMTFEVPDDGLEIQWAPIAADEEALEELQ